MFENISILEEVAFGEFSEAEKPKTSLEYSVEFKHFAEQMRLYRIPYWRLLGRAYTLMYTK